MSGTAAGSRRIFFQFHFFLLFPFFGFSFHLIFGDFSLSLFLGGDWASGLGKAHDGHRSRQAEDLFPISLFSSSSFFGISFHLLFGFFSLLLFLGGDWASG